MAIDPTMRAFKCPSCGAPLEPEVGTLTMKCPYCGGTVIIPESLRTPSPSAGSAQNGAFQFAMNGVDLNQIVGNAMHLPDAIALAKQGKLDEAAEIYSKITGIEHNVALQAVQAMAGGHAVALIPGTSSVTNVQEFGSTFTPTPEVKKNRGLTCFVVFAVFACFGIVALLGASAMFGVSLPFNPLGSLFFANQTMSFGSEGIGQGMFQNARAIGIDGNGNIIVADYEDGRVQIFDPNGKFTSLFTVTNNNKAVQATSMAVSHDGKIYIPAGKIKIFDETGTLLGEIGDGNRYYESVALGTDDTLYAIYDDTVVRFKKDYSVDLEIPNAVSSITGDSTGFLKLAVDGLGNIYIANDTPPAIFKYSPQGKFINQFGSETKHAGQFEPGKFVSPEQLAIDGYGRIFVDDFFYIQVFDSSGAYLNNISGGYYGIAFDGQNNLYATSVNDHNVVRFQIQKPAGQ